MYQQFIKPKNIIKIMLAVSAVWLISAAVQDTFSSYVEGDNSRNDEALAIIEPISDLDYILAEPETTPDIHITAVEITTTSIPENGTAADPTVVLPGSEIVYTATVRKIGGSVVSNILLIEEISRYLSFERDDVKGYFSGGWGTELMPISEHDRISIVGGFPSSFSTPDGTMSENLKWNIDRLMAGESFTMIITATVRDDVPVGTVIYSTLGNRNDLMYHVVGEVIKEVEPSQCNIISEGQFADSANGIEGASWHICEDGLLEVGEGFINWTDFSSPWSRYNFNVDLPDYPFSDERVSRQAIIKEIVFTGPITAGESLQNLLGLNDVHTIRGLEHFDTSQVTNMRGMFSGADGLTSLDLSNFDTSSVTDMSWMFLSTSNLTSLDLSSFDTSSVTNMGGMFLGATSLTSLDVSSFDTSQVRDMSSMFGAMLSLTSLDVLNFDTSQVWDMVGMFSGSSSLRSLDLSSFNTSSVTSMRTMFGRMNSLTSLDVSSFDTSSVRDMSIMFNGASSLKSLDLSNFDTSSVRDMHNMFDGASSLISLDLSNFDTSYVTNMSSTFAETTSLRELTLGDNFVFVNTWRNANLPAVPQMAEFTGYWQNVGNGTIEQPSGNHVLTSTDLMAQYNGATMADTFVWQRSSADQINPDLFTVTVIGHDASIADFDEEGNIIFSITGDQSRKFAPGDTVKVIWRLVSHPTSIPGPFTRIVRDALVNPAVEFTIERDHDNGFGIVSLVMPSSDIELTTSGWHSMVSVEGGILQDTEVNYGTYHGSPVVANTPESAFQFVRWEIVSGCESLWFLDDTSPATYLLTDNRDGWPSGTIRAVFEPISDPLAPTIDRTSDASDYMQIGDEIQFTLTISNLNNSVIYGFPFNEEIPEHVTFVEGSIRVQRRANQLFARMADVYVDVEGVVAEYVDGEIQVLFSALPLGNTYVIYNATVEEMMQESSQCRIVAEGQFADQEGANGVEGAPWHICEGGLLEVGAGFINWTEDFSPWSEYNFYLADQPSCEESAYDCEPAMQVGYIREIVFTGPIIAGESLQYLFSLDQMRTVRGLEHFDTSQVTNMSGMFQFALYLQSLDLSSFDTSRVTDMSSMFSFTMFASDLDISSFDTSQVTDMSYMFSNTGITSLDLSHFDTSQVTNMNSMFAAIVTQGVEELNISNFDTSSVTDMRDIFGNANDLRNLTLGENFTFNAEAALPDIAQTDVHTGYWQNVGDGTIERPSGSYVLTSEELMLQYDGATMADIFVWQSSSDLSTPEFITVTVIDGWLPDGRTSGEFALGDEILLVTSDPVEGYRFGRWENVLINCDEFSCIQVEFADETYPVTTFVIPLSEEKGNINVRAVFEPIDEPPVDEPPVDEPPVDEPPVDEPQADALPPVIERESNANDYIEIGEEIQFNLTVNNPNNFDIYDYTIIEELPPHFTFLTDSIQVQRRANVWLARMGNEFIDVEDVRTVYMDGEVHITIPTLAPGNTYVRFRATPREQSPGSRPPDGGATQPSGGRPPGVARPPNDQSPGVARPPDSQSPGVVQPPGNQSPGVVQPPGSQSPGTTAPPDSQPSGGEDRSSDSQPPEVEEEQSTSPSNPEAQEEDSETREETLENPDANPTSGQLPQTGVVAAGLTVLGGSALLGLGLVFAAKKKKPAAELPLEESLNQVYGKAFGEE